MAEKILVQFEAQGLDGLTAELAQASNAQEQFNAEITQTEQGTKKLTTQLRQMQDQLSRLAVAGKTNTDEYKKLREEAGKLKDAIQDAADEIKQAGSDTRGLDQAIRVTSTLVGGFAAIQGAAALFGKENENLQKSLLKVNAAMSILGGLQQIQNELMRKDSVFTEAAGKAKLLYAKAVGTATGAMKVFKLALASLGIGLAIAAIGYLVANFEKLTEKIKMLNPEYRKLLETQQQIAAGDNERAKRIAALKATTQSEVDLLDERIRVLSAYGDRDAEIFQLEKQKIQVKLNYLSELEKEAGRLTEIGKLERRKLLNDLEILNITYKKKDAQEEVNRVLDSTKKLLQEGQGERLRLIEDEFNRYKMAAEGSYQFIKALDEERRNLIMQSMDQTIAAALAEADARIEANKKVTEEEKKNIEELKKKRKDAVLFAIEQAQLLNDIILQFQQQTTNQELANLEERRDKGLISEKQYAREVAKIRQKEAEQQRRNALILAIINTAQAITRALPNFVAAALAAAFGAAQIALIARQKIPQAPGFKKGVIDLKGEGTETSDSIHARLSRGESVMTAEETKKHKEVLWAIRKKTFDRKFIPVDEAMKRHRPMAIPASVGKMAVDSDGRLVSTVQDLKEELMYIGEYIKQGNRIANKSHAELSYIKQASRYGIRV